MADDFKYDVFLSHNAKEKSRLVAKGRLRDREPAIEKGPTALLQACPAFASRRMLTLFLSPTALDLERLELERSAVLPRDARKKWRGASHEPREVSLAYSLTPLWKPSASS